MSELLLVVTIAGARVALPAAAVGVTGCVLWAAVRATSPSLWPAALAAICLAGGAGFVFIGLVPSDRAALLQLISRRAASS